MVSSSQLDTSFIQFRNTCVLGSYAIASNYYTGIPIINFFEDYYSHYGSFKFNHIQYYSEWSNLTKLQKLEVAYDDHFHNEYRQKNVPGLKLIEDLHNSSETESYKTAKQFFDVEYFTVENLNLKNLVHNLENEESLLILACDGESGGRHISVFGFDTNGLYFVETRPQKELRINYIEGIDSLPGPGDALLTIKR